MSSVSASDLAGRAKPFLDFLDDWRTNLAVVALKSLLTEYSADRTALVIVDVVNGFCREGNLSSPRVAAIVPPVVRLVNLAERCGISHYLLPQDHHPQNSLEFGIYPEHCTEGSWESETVKELQELPNAYRFKIFPKRSINPGMDPALQEWLVHHPEVAQFIVVGDCTDICVHQMAMYLKIHSVAENSACSVVVPADCVDTYDLPADHTSAAPPHPGDVMHLMFLYHMSLNGIRIVASLE